MCLHDLMRIQHSPPTPFAMVVGLDGGNMEVGGVGEKGGAKQKKKLPHGRIFGLPGPCSFFKQGVSSSHSIFVLVIPHPTNLDTSHPPQPTFSWNGKMHHTHTCCTNVRTKVGCGPKETTKNMWRNWCGRVQQVWVWCILHFPPHHLLSSLWGVRERVVNQA